MRHKGSKTRAGEIAVGRLYQTPSDWRFTETPTIPRQMKIDIHTHILPHDWSSEDRHPACLSWQAACLSISAQLRA
jgi:hypothetical protein